MIVPGSIFDRYAIPNLGHPFSWVVDVRERFGARLRHVYWISGSADIKTEQDLRKYMGRHYWALEVTRVRRCKERLPERLLYRVPEDHFLFGPHSEEAKGIKPSKSIQPLVPLWRPDQDNRSSLCRQSLFNPCTVP